MVFPKAQCNKCLIIAHAPHDSSHRRCGGAKFEPLRAKDNKLPTPSRGDWTIVFHRDAAKDGEG